MPTPRENDKLRLMPPVRMIFRQHKRRYGARRIASQLKEEGQTCSPRRVAELLKVQGLKAIQPKSFKPRTTESRHRLGYSPNLLLDNNEFTKVGQIVVADITYIPLQGGAFSYLAVLMDRVSRKIIGWSFSTDMTESLVIGALKMAIHTLAMTDGVIHHSDRGGQYASVNYRSLFRRARISQSMRRADNCYDNAFMESCYGTLKNELEMTQYENHQAAHREIKEYLTYYNVQRKHSALGYLTPNQFESFHRQPK